MSTATVSLKDQTSQDHLDILSLIDAAHKAVHNKDAAAFAARYTRDADIFNLAPPLIHRGIDLHEKNAWFDTWEGPIELESRDFKITVNGDFAFCYGYIKMSGMKKGAEQPVSFWMRETLCLQRNHGAWKIVHEHTSVPFYMDASVRPAFDLQP